MFKSACKFEKSCDYLAEYNFKNADTHQNLSKLATVITSAFLKGAHTLEELIRGILALICSM